jgi:GTP-binding protein Era
MPPGPRYYPPDQLTDTRLRDSAAEVIREKALRLFEQEIPHSLAVQVDQFKERDEDVTYIAATIYVERDSQKGIVIGRGGQMLKKLGQMARPELEEVLGTRVYLELWVKVLKNWRKDERALRRLGYHRKR